jgi:hypothetical protein
MTGLWRAGQEQACDNTTASLRPWSRPNAAMPLILLIAGLILTLTGAVLLSPLWSVGHLPAWTAYAVLLLGLASLTMVVPWMIIRGFAGMQASLATDLPAEQR